MKKYISIIVLSILMPTIIFAGFIEDLDKLFNSLYFWVQDKQEIQQNLGAATVTYPQGGGTGTSTIPVKGDLLVGSGSRNYSVLSSSTDYKILTASSSAAYGIGWTSQIGSASTRLDAFLDDLDATTLTIGGTASGDLNMGNNDILNADMVKANYFWATSTSQSSTFAGGFVSQASSTFAGDFTVGATSTQLFVDAGGNVGIGTAGPGVALDIGIASGGLSFSGAGTHTLQASAGTLQIGAFTLGGAVTGGGQTISNIFLTLPSQTVGAANDTESVSYAGGTEWQSASFTLYGKSHATTPGRYVLYTPNAALTGTTRLNITGGVDTANVSFQNSNVGIGTTTPAFILDAVGDIRAYSIATTTIEISSRSTTQGGCLKIQDTDGIGYTYCVANNGVLTCSQNPCE